MATSLATQLSRIANQTSNSLDLKARKAAHSKSLIFEPRVAASQSFHTIYSLCHEGFQELCLLDGRFLEFQRTIFSEQSQDEERALLTAEENSELNKRLENFLGLVGGRLRLAPAIKAIEWLVRRFRIHEYNTSFVITTFLPYHTLPIFATLLSILPEDVPESYKFLGPYLRSLTLPTRHAVVHAATNNKSFFSTLNAYVLHISKARQNYQALFAFWAGVIAEATSKMLDKSKSGRKGARQQNGQHIILSLLPTLNAGLAMKKMPDLRVACYMLLTVMASKGGLGDRLITPLMEAVALGWTVETTLPGLVCLAILAQYRGAKQITKRLTKELLKIQNLPSLLTELSKERRVDKLTNGLCLALIDRLGRTGDVASLSIVLSLVENQLVNDAQILVIFQALLLVARKIANSSGVHEGLRPHLASSLVTFTQLPGHAGSVVCGALEATAIDIDELEVKLRAPIRRVEVEMARSEDRYLQDQSVNSSGVLNTFSELFNRLPKRTVNESSFLSHEPSHVYQDLCLAFIASLSTTENTNVFDRVPILRRDSALENTLYLSFYMKTWCGPGPVLARTSALQMATRFFLQRKGSTVDVQAVIPYAIAALGDSATKVRRAAGNLFIGIDQLYPKNIEPKKKENQFQQWGFQNIYGPGNHTEETKWLSLDLVIRLLREIIIPSLEECVLDSRNVQSLFEKSLDTPRNPESQKKHEARRLPQAARASIFSFLASHVVHTPLFSVKLRLLTSLNRLRSIAGTSRTRFLLPALKEWVSTSPSEVSDRCKEEQLSPEEMDGELLMTIVATDEEGRDYMSRIISGEVLINRPALIEAVFGRLRSIWPSLKRESHLQICRALLASSQSSPDEVNYNSATADASADLLRTAPLSTESLLSFLSQLPTAAKLADKPPVTKRRQTSHGEVVKSPIQDSKQLSVAIREVTFVLQLVDSSDPSKRPELTKELFNTLAELLHFKSHVTTELAYLQGLALGSLLAIMKAHKSYPALKLDRSSIRADLLVDCVQKTASPQVQNSALLLIASLANAAPELVLHSVMPIFTFMGSSVLRQNDEYSAHVINQTIRQVIPPLIASLREEKGDPVTGAAELLLSFVAAYEHVPAHRRRDLMASLVETLGPGDFLYALLAMVVDKYGLTEDIKTFTAELSGAFGVEVQLRSFIKHLDLVGDILKPKPSHSAILLSGNDGNARDPRRCALDELMLLPHLISQKRLISQTAKFTDRDDMDAARIRDLYSTLLENLLCLAGTLKDDKRLRSACGDVLESILGLLSTREFVKLVEDLLNRPSAPLRRKILRSLEVRIDQESPSDAVSRLAMLGFLPQLTAIIRESQDTLYKHTAVACVDKISEMYGKKDVEAVSAAAETIASNHCLGQSDDHLRVMALLCLASLVEILREGIVSVLPIALPKALEYMEESLSGIRETHKLHNAAYTFIGSVVHHLPYMVSSGYLDKFLMISSASAEANLGDDADDNRIQCLRFAAKQIDAKSMFTALERDLEVVSAAGVLALREYLEILNVAIDQHPKSQVTKYSATLAIIFRNAFDLRRKWSVAADNRCSADMMAEIEAKINEIAVRMIYKFNDSTFRPIFASLVEWAASSLPEKDKTGRTLRLQSIYGFMVAFFESLKSIVTSYATYIVENAVDILQNIDLKDEASQQLWSKVLRVLARCFENDQDDFWQTPSHFNSIAPALCGQFIHASRLPLAHDLIPAIVELAASDDSPDHHKELNVAILKHMRSDIPAVRLAAIRCEEALTDRLGEEWLSMLPEMLPFISELQEDDDDMVEKETHRWIVKIEGVLGESLDSMLQ